MLDNKKKVVIDFLKILYVSKILQKKVGWLGVLPKNNIVKISDHSLCSLACSSMQFIYHYSHRY
jgi:hypothetical protein